MVSMSWMCAPVITALELLASAVSQSIVLYVLNLISKRCFHSARRDFPMDALSNVAAFTTKEPTNYPLYLIHTPLLQIRKSETSNRQFRVSVHLRNNEKTVFVDNFRH